MNTKYQLITIGHNESLIPEILDVFFRKIDDLGMERNLINIINASNFSSEYIANAPTFCLYFGTLNGPFNDFDILEILIKKAELILPVVDDLDSFSKKVPVEIKGINGFALKDVNSIESIVSVILEGFNLLRLSRRLFISYKRTESTSVAIQLFERFENSGFDVFLDTHSVRPGEPFQEELWHRLADTDIVVLLNTKTFLDSGWTPLELAQANAMSIGIVQLLWPDFTQDIATSLTSTKSLKVSDFDNLSYSKPSDYLTDDAIKEIIAMSESLRARSLAARQDNIITEFISVASKLSIPIQLHPEKFILVTRKDGKKVIVIPTVGVPQAFTYHQSEELVNKIKSEKITATYLLYDHINIRQKWLNHLDWLNQYLVVKSIKVIEIDEKLNEIINEQ